MTRAFAAALLLAVAGCAQLTGPREVIASPARDWRMTATGADRERLREWREAFVEGLAEARAAGHGAAIAAEGELLQPDAGLAAGAIPVGDYRCRVIKLGARTPGMLPYVAYPAFSCRVAADGEVQAFAKLTGSQRPVGLIFPGDAMRQVFLGTLVLGDETRALRYGHDPDRDLAGYVERIGPARWRIIFPRPAFESDLDVIELVPLSGRN